MAKREKLWRFSCEMDRLDNGYYRIRLVSASGKVIIREGYNGIWELLRAVYWQKSNIEDNGPLGQDDRPAIIKRGGS